MIWSHLSNFWEVEGPACLPLFAAELERYGIFGADANTDIREEENSECGYQICVTKIQYVMAAGFLTNFILNIRALNRKTLQLLPIK